eukprot:TRINITY_DN3824_c0_g1_i3.p1 TRINITY_DN3824_c0_g1~~TRINITY_DN3824_c0_g1_i3.p1  ORF type:complete len:803 (-),score=152.20 TRINITY_DN3824_c0_g1_i3:26-2434(-)
MGALCSQENDGILRAPTQRSRTPSDSMEDERKMDPTQLRTRLQDLRREVEKVRGELERRHERVSTTDFDSDHFDDDLFWSSWASHHSFQAPFQADQEVTPTLSFIDHSTYSPQHSPEEHEPWIFPEDSNPTERIHPRNGHHKQINFGDRVVSHAALTQAFAQLDKKGLGRVDVNDFVEACQCMELGLQVVEATRLWESVTTEPYRAHDGALSFPAFQRAVRRCCFLKCIVSNYAERNEFVVPADYDFSAPTSKSYQHPDYVVSNVKQYSSDVHGSLVGEFKGVRSAMDFSFHPNYSEQRQLWQDQLVRNVAIRTCAQPQPWVVFTCGAMGAGKGYAMSWMSRHGVFPLEQIVHIDPDYFKHTMPEWKGYVRYDRETGTQLAGSQCHLESGALQEIATEVSLSSSQHVWIDGSLQDSQWYSEVFQDIRQRHPQYRIALFYIFSSTATVLERATERGKQTGRFVPEDVLLDSIQRTQQSVNRLAPLADFLSVINNEQALPRLVWVAGRSDSWLAVRNRFQNVTSDKVVFPHAMPKLPMSELENAKSLLPLTKEAHSGFCSPLCNRLIRVPLSRALSMGAASELKGMFTCKAAEIELVFSPAIQCDQSSLPSPEGAVWISMCHGAMTQDGSRPLANRSASSEPNSRLLSLLTLGGWAFLNTKGRVVSVTVISSQLDLRGQGGIVAPVVQCHGFGVPRFISRSHHSNSMVSERWVPISDGWWWEHPKAGAQEAGAASYAWIRPGELQGAPEGGVLFHMASSRPYNGEFSPLWELSLIHISEPTRLLSISYAVFCLKKKKKKNKIIK